MSLENSILKLFEFITSNLIQYSASKKIFFLIKNFQFFQNFQAKQKMT